MIPTMAPCNSAGMATGLREMKRQVLARKLADIAFSLTKTQGFDQTTIDQIVAEAMVSRRTFSNYFDCKEHAVAQKLVHSASDGLRGWDTPSQDLGVVQRVRNLTQHQAVSGTLEVLVELAALANEHGQLSPYLREAQWQVWALAGESVIDTFGPMADARVVREVTAVVGAVFAIMTKAVIDAAEPEPLEVLGDLTETFDALAQAFD